MKISFKHGEDLTPKDFETNKIEIDFSEDVSFTIAINKFGDLVIIKSQFGAGEGGIVIRPIVSNEIHLT